MKFEIDSAGNATAQLLNQNGSNLDSAGNILSWATTLKNFGEVRDDVSQIRLKQTTDPADTAGDIVGTVSASGNPNILDVTIDTNTLPSNTQGVVDAVINPQTNTPGDGTLSAASNGDRYLITADIAGGTGWLGSTAKKNDIIQYDSGGSQWNIVFDASSGSSPQIITNNTTQDKLKWNGTNWVNAFEGTYNPGFWRLYI